MCVGQSANCMAENPKLYMQGHEKERRGGREIERERKRASIFVHKYECIFGSDRGRKERETGSVFVHKCEFCFLLIDEEVVAFPYQHGCENNGRRRKDNTNRSEPTV